MNTEETRAIKVSYTDEDVANAAQRDKWREGTYRAVLVDAIRDISKDNGHLMIVNTYRALRDPNDASSIFGFAIKHWQCLPFRNPNRDGHVPAKFFAQSTNNWLSGHFPEEVIALPVKTDEGFFFKGEPLEPSEMEAAKKEAYDSSYAKADALWNEDDDATLESLKGTAVYFDLYYGKNKETGEPSDFPSLRNFRSELGPNEELVDPETALQAVAVVVDEEEVDEDEEVEEAPVTKMSAKAKTNGKNGHAKAAPKPAPKVAAKGKRK